MNEWMLLLPIGAVVPERHAYKIAQSKRMLVLSGTLRASRPSMTCFGLMAQSAPLSHSQRFRLSGVSIIQRLAS